MNKIALKYAGIDAGIAGLYVVGIANFLAHTKDLFGPDEPKTVLVPIMMLLLVIISASVTGSAVFGRPVMWYLDGKKREALMLLAWTLVFLACIAAVFITTLLAMR